MTDPMPTPKEHYSGPQIARSSPVNTMVDGVLRDIEGLLVPDYSGGQKERATQAARKAIYDVADYGFAAGVKYGLALEEKLKLLHTLSRPVAEFVKAGWPEFAAAVKEIDALKVMDKLNKVGEGG